MNKILAFSTSNSSKSLSYATLDLITDWLPGYSIELLDIRNWNIPIYSQDLEKTMGIPEKIEVLFSYISNHERIMLSIAEHNGFITAFFKNILDWLSRKDRGFLKGKKIFLLGVSPSPGGAKRAVEMLSRSLPYFGGVIVDTFLIPKIHENINWLVKPTFKSTEIEEVLKKQLIKFERT